jgi:hypothetical protein
MSVYILKFGSITDVLIANRVLSPVHRVVNSFGGIGPEEEDKAIKFCTQKHTRQSAKYRPDRYHPYDPEYLSHPSLYLGSFCWRPEEDGQHSN